MPSPQIAIPTPRRRLSLLTAFDTFSDDFTAALNAKKPKSPASPPAENMFQGPPPPPPSPVSWERSNDYFSSQKPAGKN